MTELEARLVAEIEASGPMLFERFVEQALYDENLGFYAHHGQAGGRRGDFITSVEVGPLFAAIVAGWLDAVWHEFGEPAVFRVSEVGAGVGTLFRGINRAAPDCFDALTYTLVERSAALRAMHQDLPTEQWRSAGEWPTERQHVILANELLDNLAFGIAERVPGGWAHVHVGLTDSNLAFETAEADEGLGFLAGLAQAAAPGQRVPVAHQAAAWVRSAQGHADRVLAIDYAASTGELASRGQQGWLRTYVDHNRGNDPLVEVGLCDITHDVPVDQLPEPTKRQTQAEWLSANGLEDLLAAARAVWQERGHIGDLQAMTARSALNEAEALTDQSGLGAFTVLEWHG